MAVEAIQKVTQTEQDAKRRKEEATAESKQKVLVAQRAAQRLLEDAHSEAEAEARQMMARAEDEAVRLTQEALEQAARECEAMKQAARLRLDQAAQLIVEKVVNR